MPGSGQIPKFFCPEENLHFQTKFLNFSEKFVDSSPKISDDLFSFFSHLP